MISLYDLNGNERVTSIDTTPLKDIQERNKTRVEAFKTEMGTRHLLHPANHVVRLKVPRN